MKKRLTQVWYPLYLFPKFLYLSLYLIILFTKKRFAQVRNPLYQTLLYLFPKFLYLSLPHNPLYQKKVRSSTKTS